MRRAAAQVVELAGAAALVYGVSLLAVWLAWIVAGLSLIVAASMIEGSER